MLKTEIGQSATITIDALVEEAVKIDKKINKLKKEKIPDDKIILMIKEKHPNFYTAYSFIVNHSITTGDFHPRAFRKYVDRIKKSPITTDDDFIGKKVYYICELFKAHNTHYNPNELMKLRSRTYDIMQNELEHFKAVTKKATEDEDARIEQFNMEKRNELSSFLELLKGISAPMFT